MFEARELRYTYPSGRPGLRSVTLAGGPGERIVVMGPNGCGKSTLLGLVSTAFPSPRGTLHLFGQSNRTASGRIRRRLGVVQDEPVHEEALTGWENARLFGELYGMPTRAIDAALGTLLPLFGLSEVRDVPVAEYSYGMRRKLLLVEALAHQPDLLVLDEPTLALDPPSTTALLRVLEQRSEAGTCILAATNDPALAERLATRVAFLLDGALVAQGPPQELLRGLRGSTRIDIRLAERVVCEVRLEGVSITASPGRVVAKSPTGLAVLPRLTDAILGTGSRITGIDVREPDLADVFMQLTGRDLRPDDPARVDGG